MLLFRSVAGSESLSIMMPLNKRPKEKLICREYKRCLSVGHLDEYLLTGPAEPTESLNLALTLSCGEHGLPWRVPPP